MKMSQSDMSAGGAGGPRARKQRLPSHSSEDGKKPRGRPRVEPHDETAADRRRTQIRLAQRAYRLRKETTISSLKQRTTELKNIIDDMNAAFSKFTDLAQAAGLDGLNFDVASSLRDTEEAFSQLKEKSRACFEDGPDAADKSTKTRSATPSDSGESGGSPAKKRRLSKPDEDSSPSEIDYGKGTNAWGYEMVYDTNSAEPPVDGSIVIPAFAPVDALPNLDAMWTEMSGVQQSVPTAPSTRAVPTKKFKPERDQQQAQKPQGQRPSYSLVAISDTIARAATTDAHALKVPYSYAFRESTFARQLHRTTLETACHLIQQRKIKPGLFRKKFQLCLPYGDGNAILKKITDTLKRAPHETLDWTDHPLRHLGGAGTHHGRRGDSGRSSPLAKLPPANASSLGASELAALMNSASEADTSGRVLSIAGLEGEWFDPQDVEAYLEEKGLRYESGSVAATVDICTELPLPKPHPSTAGSNLDALDFMELTKRAGKRHIAPQSRRGSLDIHTSRAANKWEFGSDSRSVNSDSGVAALSPQSLSQPEAKRVVVDVQRLIRDIVKGATCLGRCPGFRRRDIDRAFTTAVAAAG